MASLKSLLTESNTVGSMAQALTFCQHHLGTLVGALETLAQLPPASSSSLPLESKSEQSATLAANALANLGRHGAQVRTRLAEAGIVPALHRLLSNQLNQQPPAPLSVSLLVALFRTTANLVVDHPDNRQLLVDAQFANVLAQCLQAYVGYPEVTKTILGAMLNLIIDHEVAAKALVAAQAIEPLIVAFDRYGSAADLGDHMVFYLVVRNLNTLVDVDEALDPLTAAHAATRHVLDFSKYQQVAFGVTDGMASDIGMELVSVLQAMVRHPPIQAQIVQDAKMPQVLGLTEVLVLGSVLEAPAVAGLQELTRALQQLAVTADSDDETGSDDDKEASDKSQEKTSDDQPLVLSIAQILISTTSNDDNMSPLLHDSATMACLRRWLNLLPAQVHASTATSRWAGPEGEKQLQERVERLQSFAALCLGNLARSDAHCLALVQQDGIAESLVALLQATKNYELQHAVMGLLRNLTIPQANKAIFNQTPLLEIAAQLVDTKIHQLQLNSIRVLKHLVSTRDRDMACRMLRPLTPKTAPALVHSIELATRNLTASPCSPIPPAPTTQPKFKLDNTPLGLVLGVLQHPGVESTLCEGSRVVAEFIRGVFDSNAPCPLYVDKKQAVNDQSLKVPDIIRTHVKEIVRPLMYLLTRTKFPILVNEGLMAMILYAENCVPFLFLKAMAYGFIDPTESDDQPAPAPPSDAEEPTQQSRMDLDWLPPLLRIVRSDATPLEIRSNGLHLLTKLTQHIATQPSLGRDLGEDEEIFGTHQLAKAYYKLRLGISSIDPAAVASQLAPAMAKAPMSDVTKGLQSMLKLLAEANAKI
ncbi:Rap1 GTPase-GDP dissociation stimulator 1 [Dimargaris verticillata]|uniref:Rap1 GTPase-GDP dissociation stimulator 1 n=1 Tax=Dimargaris verticillata TaxID=2761393 RepID=A0A9W8B9F4_9FUNG|nr:Rap1 GTPase-GDP dissociation stimulator 1 [Dimargaris verticillata]